jgi:DNA-binding PadR family transcriptional regulator
MRRGWGWSDFGFGATPRGAFVWGGRGGRRRWFEAGDMKYVILKLLRDKPRHGYEVMKELEERFGGCYSPSPGTVYPTLQWLEDEGLVSAKDIEGKKVYEITDAGRAFLEEHRDVVDDIFERVRDAVDQALGGAMGEVNEAVGRLMKTAYRTAWRSRDEAIRRKIAETLRRAAAEIEALTSEATSRRS